MKLFKLLVLGIVGISMISCQKDCLEDEFDFYANRPYKIELVKVLDPEGQTSQQPLDWTVGPELCSKYGLGNNELFYMEASTFENSNYIFRDRDGKYFAKSGWYSNGVRYFYWSGIHLQVVLYCND
jgi:hypothetical protein